MADEATFHVESSDPAASGPHTLAALVELRRSNKLPGTARVSRDRQSWESLDALLDREAPEEGVFVDCRTCQRTGKLERLPGLQTTLLFAISLVLLALLGAMGVGATSLILWKLKLGGAEWGAWVFATSSGAFAFLRQLTESEFRLTRKWQAWWSGTCPDCEAGLRRRREIGLPSMLVYLLDLFLFQEVLIPTYRTLTYQWLWRDERPKDESRLGRAWKVLGFSLLIFGPVPFLAFLAGRNSPVTLGVSALVVFVVWRFTFQKSTTPYTKGVAFLLVPLYYVSMVEIIRWCWVLSLPPEGAPPDTSDLYLLGVDTLLSTQLFMGLPNKVGIKLFSGSVDTALTGWAVFYLRLLLDMSLIAALAKALVSAIWSAQVFRQTGLKGGLGKVDAKAIPTLQEIALKRDAKEIGKLEKALKDVVGSLLLVRDYARGVAAAAQPGSGEKGAAERSLALLESADLRTFAGGDRPPEKKAAPRGPTAAERLLAVLFVALWAGLIAVFFQGAITRALKRDVADLVERAQQPELKDSPLARRVLYERALRKVSDLERALRRDAAFAKLVDRLLLLASGTDLDVAGRRLFLLDLDQALIEIDTAFQKTIHLDEVLKAEQKRESEARGEADFVYVNPYLAQVKELSARAYGQRARVFYLRNDRERAVLELRKERTPETRRVLYLLALDRAAEDLLGPAAESELTSAVQELGFDEGYKPGLLVPVGRAMRRLREGKLEDGLARLRPLEASLDAFSPELRGDVRYVIAEALLRVGPGERESAIATLRSVVKEWADHGEARLALAHALRLDRKPKEAAVELAAAAALPDEATSGHAKLLLALLAFERGDRPEARRLLVEIASARGDLTDALFREDLGDFASGAIGPEELRARAVRWREDQHYAQTTLAQVAIALDAIARKKLGAAALELRQVVIEGDPGHAEVDLARALLDLIQVESEKRSFNPELFFHQLHLNRIGRRIRDEIRRILFPAEEITAVLTFALADKRPEERSRAIASVAGARLLAPMAMKAPIESGLADKEASVRLAALEALGGEGAEAATASLPKVLTLVPDKDDRVRRAAVRVIQVAGGEASERALEQALEDKDRYVRRDAAYALAKVGPVASHALTGLVKHMDDPEIMVRDAALAGVRSLDLAGAEALVASIGTVKDTEVSIQAIKHLELAYPDVYARERERITTFALRVLDRDADPACRRWAAVRLAGLPRDERVAVAPVLSSVDAGLHAAFEQTKDVSVRVGIAGAALEATRTYGLDPALATGFFVTAVREHPNVKGNLLRSTVDPRIGEAAFHVVVALLAEKDTAPQGSWLASELAAAKLDVAEVASGAVARLLPLCASGDARLAKDAQECFNAVISKLPGNATAPALLERLGDPVEAVRETAFSVVQVKGFTPSPTLRARLVAGLLSSDPGVRRTHFRELRYLAFEDESVLDAMARAATSDPDADVQGAALRAVARHADVRERVVPELGRLGLLSRNDDLGKGALVLALAALGPEKAFASLGPTPDASARKRFVQAVAEWGAQPALGADPASLGGALARLLDDADASVLQAALGALLAPEPRKDLAPATPRLERLVAESKDAKVLPLAQAALVIAAPERAGAGVVRDVLATKDAGLGKRAVAALEASSSPDRAASIACALSSTQAAVRVAASRALAGLGAQAHAPLRAALEGPSAEAREAALEAIAAQGSAALPLADPVVQLLGTAGPKLGAVAVKALGRIGHAPARDTIRELVAKQPDPVLEAECWVALGRLGLPGSSQQILRLLDSGAAPTAAYAAYLAGSLVEVDRDAGLRYLLGALRERYGRLNASSAAALLGGLGPIARPALRELQTLAQDTNPDVREAASLAVEKIRGSK